MISLGRLQIILIVMLCLSGVARAQTSGARVTASGSVSEIVTLSFDEGVKISTEGAGITSSYREGRGLVINLAGTARNLTRVSLPIRIRSNTGYRLFARAESDGAKLALLSVVEARPTGKLVAADAETLRVARGFDARAGVGSSSPAEGFNRPGLSSPVELLSGPRVSLGGTLASPLNALEVTLSIVVEPRAGVQVWALELLLTAEPDARL